MAEMVLSVDLEVSLDGAHWRTFRFISILPYKGQKYAVIIQNLAIQWFDTQKKAIRFARSLDFQLGKISLILALMGSSPRVVNVRYPNNEIEVIDTPSM